jgi:hypothetical protein
VNAMNPLKPPHSSGAVLEARVLLDLATMGAPLVRSFLNRSASPRQQAVPGFGANDRYTWPLRVYLKSLGDATTGWGLGTNRAGLNIPHSFGDVHPRWKLRKISPYRGEAGVLYVIDRLIDPVDELSTLIKQPIALIGRRCELAFLRTPPESERADASGGTRACEVHGAARVRRWSAGEARARPHAGAAGKRPKARSAEWPCAANACRPA